MYKVQRVTDEWTDKIMAWFERSGFDVQVTYDGTLQIITATGPFTVKLIYFGILVSADVDFRRYNTIDVFPLSGLSKEKYEKYIDRLVKIGYEIRRLHGNVA